MKPLLKAASVALAIVSGAGTFIAAAASPTPTPSQFMPAECVRPARTPEVSAWIQTPGPAGTPVIQKTAKPSSGAWQPPTVSLKDLPTGPDASGKTTAALARTLTEISQCAAFPSDGVDAYFSDDFFRRTAVVTPAMPGSGTRAGFTWGYAGISAFGQPPQIVKAWSLPGGKTGAIVESSPNAAPLFIVFVQSPTAGYWLIDEMAYLADALATPPATP